MAVQTEGARLGDWLKWEMDGRMSRKAVTIASGQSLKSGTVLGKISLGAATATAFSGNTGNGVCGDVTVGAGAKVGIYKLTVIEPASDAGAFMVEDPDGVQVGVGDIGTAFTGGGLSFTLADGLTDFAAGDGFDIAVAEGTGQYNGLDDDATDGSAVAAGILVEDVDATDAAVDGVMVFKDARIDTRGLTWVDASAGAQTAALAQLELSGIVAGELG